MMMRSQASFMKTKKLVTYFYYHMASQKSVICKDVIVPNFAIMCNVTRPHDEIVIANYLVKIQVRVIIHGKHLRFHNLPCKLLARVLQLYHLILKIGGWRHIL